MDHRKYVERYLKKVQEEAREPNKTLILDFVAQERAEGRSEARILEYLRRIYEIDKLLGKPFRKAERRDIVRVINEIEAKDTKIKYVGKERKEVKGKLSETTIVGYKISIKKFWKWLNGGEEYPQPVRWIKCTRDKTPAIKQKDILTPEEVAAMINSAKNLRDRALIGLTYETGARSGELWDLKREDVEFTPEGAVIHVTNEKYNKGKKRHVPVVMCARDLMNYMNSMDDKRPEAFLWLGLEGTKTKERVQKQSFNKIFKMAAENAGINKRIWVHGMRHIRISHVKDKLTEQVQKSIFGWSPRSNMPGYYGVISNEQVVSSVFKNVYGIQSNGNGKKETACSRCGALQNYDSESCWRCSLIFDEKKRQEETDIKKELEGIKAILISMPEYKKRLRERGLIKVTSM